MTPRMRKVWFDSYVQRLLEKDLGDIAPRVEPTRVASVLRLIAASQAGELVKARNAGDVGIPESSAKVYLDLLETRYLTRRLPPWTPNLTSREVARPKMVLNDSGPAPRLAQLTEQHLLLLESPWMGPAMEGFVVGELLKQQSFSDDEHELFHFRDRDGLEVDTVIEFHDGSGIGWVIASSADTSSTPPSAEPSSGTVSPPSPSPRSRSFSGSSSPTACPPRGQERVSKSASAVRGLDSRGARAPARSGRASPMSIDPVSMMACLRAETQQAMVEAERRRLVIEGRTADRAEAPLRKALGHTPIRRFFRKTVEGRTSRS